MDNRITIEVAQDGNIEQCRELCNELMAFQKANAQLRPELFDAMNFDTRMKRSYERALASQVLVAKEDGVPVGYAFSTIDDISQSRHAYPDWAPRAEQGAYLGFYPDWDDLPDKAGCLNNLYIRDGYRHLGLGSKLFGMAMDWLDGFRDADVVFIFVSNGNEAALNFYLSRGFAFSHDVFGGFIQATYRRRT
ncbi:GNAT family N-acetyltransferase [Paenibacillus sp. MWE-103]|uniref:GNAT family N-acetyltransferase n=1 Tax=Paenibacillus artemisiicola TaxID=1172618 RepID=A0ABS3WEV2_9BACL|nr:GNAT family N-acetyltransferase [Paenibacillus artemisiicola]MBO7746823.1 GNAT family N-acetyltransferase [Paenibacillus artemisiicola]